MGAAPGRQALKIEEEELRMGKKPKERNKKDLVLQSVQFLSPSGFTSSNSCWRRSQGFKKRCGVKKERTPDIPRLRGIWSELTKTANLYLANGEAFLLSADEWIAGQDRARKALAWSEAERRQCILFFSQCVAT